MDIAKKVRKNGERLIQEISPGGEEKQISGGNWKEELNMSDDRQKLARMYFLFFVAYFLF